MANRQSVAAASVGWPMTHAPSAATDMRKFMSSAPFLAARMPRGTTNQPPAMVESASNPSLSSAGAPTHAAETPSVKKNAAAAVIAIRPRRVQNDARLTALTSPSSATPKPALRIVAARSLRCSVLPE